MVDTPDVSTALIQPFRRNLDVDPILIPVGVTGISTPVAPMTGGGVTTFKLHNPNPFWVWLRGWSVAGNFDGAAIKEKGHYIAPGAVDICRTQMPAVVGAVGNAEADLALYPKTASAVATDTDGCILWNGVRCRLVMIYGSGG